jgi:hypothetical protein
MTLDLDRMKKLAQEAKEPNELDDTDYRYWRSKSIDLAADVLKLVEEVGRLRKKPKRIRKREILVD